MKSKRLESRMITFGQERVGQAWSCGELIPWTRCSGACEAAPVDTTTTWNINISFNNYKCMPSPSTRAHTHTHTHMHLHQCTMQIIHYCSMYPPFFSSHVYTGLLRRYTYIYLLPLISPRQWRVFSLVSITWHGEPSNQLENYACSENSYSTPVSCTELIFLFFKLPMQVHCQEMLTFIYFFLWNWTPVLPRNVHFVF